MHYCFPIFSAEKTEALTNQIAHPNYMTRKEENHDLNREVWIQTLLLLPHYIAAYAGTWRSSLHSHAFSTWHTPLWTKKRKLRSWKLGAQDITLYYTSELLNFTAWPQNCGMSWTGPELIYFEHLYRFLMIWACGARDRWNPPINNC